MTTYLMALLIFTGGGFIQQPSEPRIAESFYFDEKGEIKMKNPTTEDCYFYRQDSVTFKVFCRKEEEKINLNVSEEKSYQPAIISIE